MNRHFEAMAQSTPRPRTRGDNNQDWRQWSAVKAWIPNLPYGSTTSDIHKNLKRFGNVEFIRIEETKQGAFSRTAIVNFK